MKFGLPTQRVLRRALFSLQLVEAVTLSLSKGEPGVRVAGEVAGS